MTAPATDTALQPARTKLAQAIAALIDPRRVTLPTGRHTWLDSVFQELSDAVYEKHALGGGTANPASPLWLDASDCLQAINALARNEHPENPGFYPEDRFEPRLEHPTVLRLQAIDARKWRPQDVPRINRLSADLERLTLKAQNLLTPPTHWFLPNPCPLCGRTHVYVNNSGDMIRRPALTLTPDYCRCGNPDCEGWWPASRFQLLGRLLGYRPPEGVIGE